MTIAIIIIQTCIVLICVGVGFGLANSRKDDR